MLAVRSIPLAVLFRLPLVMPGLTPQAVGGSTRPAQQVVFLVDMSNGIAADTYPIYPNEHFAYELVTGGAQLTAEDLPCTSWSGGTPTIALEDVAQFIIPAQRSSWSALPEWPLRHRPESATDLDHYKNDYRCWGTSAKGPRRYFLINAYAMPQPLVNVMAGIHSGLKMLATRDHVPGDAVGYIFYDQNHHALRSSPGMLPVDVDNGDFTKFYAATDVTNFPSSHAVDLLMFPTHGSFNHVSQAIQSAMKLLDQAPDVAMAEKRIVLFSDLHGTCMLDASDPPEEFLDAVANYDDPTQFTSPPAQCGMTDAHFAASLAETFNLAGELASKGIRLDLAKVAKRGLPNTMIYSNNGHGCLRNDELRELIENGHDLALAGDAGTNPARGSNYPGGFENRNYSECSPWEGGNRFWEAALITDGMWSPIRPACPAYDLSSGAPCGTLCVLFGPDCPETNPICAHCSSDCMNPPIPTDACEENVLSHFDYFCAWNPGIQPVIIEGNGAATLGDIGYTHSGCSFATFHYSLGGGRLICEPSCRPEPLQLEDMMAELFGF
jgi:hypothetical protein